MSQIHFPEFPSIVADLEYCDGQPRIEGTRITVSSILSYMAGGMSIEQILADFPSLTKEKILQALGFATMQLQAKYIPLKKLAV